jgi:hypothetical protein
MNKGLSLYKRILKEHKLRLPAEMRKLGDDYVKNEFRLHKSSTNREHIDKFYVAWTDYLAMLLKRNGRIGQDLNKSDRVKLSKDQEEKLSELQHHAQNPQNE